MDSGAADLSWPTPQQIRRTSRLARCSALREALAGTLNGMGMGLFFRPDRVLVMPEKRAERCKEEGGLERGRFAGNSCAP